MKNILKKAINIFCIMTILAGMVFVFAGCGGDDGDDGNSVTGPGTDPIDEPFTGTYKYERFDSTNNCTSTKVLTLIQTGNILTGDYDCTYACVRACTANLIVSVTGTVTGQNTAMLTIPSDEGDCVGGGYEVEVWTRGGTYSMWLSDDGTTLFLQDGSPLTRQ